MKGNLAISNYLADVYDDWQDSQELSRNNVFLASYWPIPFSATLETRLLPQSASIRRPASSSLAEIGLRFGPKALGKCG